MEDAKMDYPVIIKPDDSLCTKLAHAKYFINGQDGYSEMYSNQEFLKEDLDIEELVPHSEELLIKVYCFSDHAMFWKVDPSISECFFHSNSYITNNRSAMNIQMIDKECK